MTNSKITQDSLSEFEKILIIAAREADDRAREDALNLLRSRKNEEYIVQGEIKKTKSHGITRGAEYYNKSKKS